MEEKLFYQNNAGRNLLVQAFIPRTFDRNVYLILDSLFDEKSKSHKFNTDLARQLCERGSCVFRFDYYGTGDSGGNTYEFDFALIFEDIRLLYREQIEPLGFKNFILIGSRVGADIALSFSSQFPEVNNLILIEPIVSGSRFLMEQRFRRKAFHNLNNMKNVESIIQIAGKQYEDFQGYPLSPDAMEYLENLNSSMIDIKSKKINLIKLQFIQSDKIVAQLKKNLEKNNSVFVKNIECADFWASLDPIDTESIRKEIVVNDSNYA